MALLYVQEHHPVNIVFSALSTTAVEHPAGPLLVALAVCAVIILVIGLWSRKTR
jgi:uncharacterized membrane protein YjdF